MKQYEDFQMLYELDLASVNGGKINWGSVAGHCAGGAIVTGAFVTTHSEFMPLAFQYQVSALDYIDKELPHTEFVQRVETALLYAVRQNSETIAESAFYFTSRYAQVQVPFNDILYIETSSRAHRVNLYTKKERMQFTGTLTDILKQESRFLQCHRSFLINPRNVVRVDKIERVVYFRNGSSCLIARSKMNSVLTTIENLYRGDN
ncbi:LytTR family DNA-binding domain-containing protein [Streptococcus equi subsp. zooepidemicus]|nr:LytTR family DNA-binding domain-containing protein [Streptococcus equi subsp. zooepidemicus]